LKSTLLNLELKRTELLEKFEPTYRLVQEADTQVAQTRAAIEAAEKSQLREETTDRNPIYEWVDSELAKARSDLAAGQARAEALSRSVRSYEEQARNLDQNEVVEQGLLRDQKAQEANYLLYQRKQEEARISNALDSSRIVNVAVAEEAAVPAVPSRSRPSALLAGLLAAIAASIAAAVAAERLNPSLRTTDDVKAFLDVPVLASVSSRGR
jgi:succinoglycan biosynthesis transport protein ExoP